MRCYLNNAWPSHVWPFHVRIEKWHMQEMQGSDLGPTQLNVRQGVLWRHAAATNEVTHDKGCAASSSSFAMYIHLLAAFTMACKHQARLQDLCSLTPRCSMV